MFYLDTNAGVCCTSIRCVRCRCCLNYYLIPCYKMMKNAMNSKRLDGTPKATNYQEILAYKRLLFNVNGNELCYMVGKNSFRRV